MNGRTARLLVTRRCQRRCDGCCNEYPSLMARANLAMSLEALDGYSEVCVTGGEPLLNPARTRGIVEELRGRNEERRIYLYTAQYTPELGGIVPALSGVHYSLHAPASEQDMEWLGLIQKLAIFWPDRSWRLYIDRRVNRVVSLLPRLWARVEIKAWLPEGNCPLPAHEDLFLLESEDWPEGG
jgi:hypothetical protein